jgi:hypothetical protein
MRPYLPATWRRENQTMTDVAPLVIQCRGDAPARAGRTGFAVPAVE